MSTPRNGHGHRAYRRAQAALKRRTAAENLHCWWCGEQIDITLPAGHRDAFTADHPDALANGGRLAGQEPPADASPLQREQGRQRGRRHLARVLKVHTVGAVSRSSASFSA